MIAGLVVVTSGLVVFGVFLNWARRRPAPRRVLFVGWVVLWIGVSLVTVELASRRWLAVPAAVGRHPVQPYLVYGNVYGYGLANDQPMLEREGPGAYGYRQAGGMYTYTFRNKVSSIAERGAFLFQDRVELANDTTTSTVRVFTLGGSAAYGFGASSNDTRWYAVLERALSASLGREVRLIPGAMGGYVSTQERLVLELMVLPRRPDAVIVFDGFNDAALPAELGSRPGDPYNQGVLYQEAYSPFFGLKRWFVRQSHLYSYMVHKSLQQALEANRRRVVENPGRLQNYVQSAASVYLDNVSHMLERCKDRRVPCLVFIQPALALTRRYQGGENKIPGDILTVATYEEILRRLRERPSDPPVHDLTAVFNGPDASGWFEDGVHFTDPGHKAVAEAMLPAVLEALRARPEKQRAPIGAGGAKTSPSGKGLQRN